MGKAKKKKDDKLTKVLLDLRLLVTGIAFTGCCGLLMLTDSAFYPVWQSEQRAVVSAEEEEAKAAAIKKAAALEKASASARELVQQEFVQSLVLPEPTVKKMTFPKFKKAAIGEYDLSAAETRSKKVIIKSEPITDPNDFTVPFPDQEVMIYYPERKEPQNLTATRSVAGEYYRVHDERSGSTVVVNGHEALCLMVNNEIGDTWDEDAIKAQTVAAYTYLRYNKERKLTPTIALRYGYSEKLEKCVSEVEGQAMHYDGEIICAVYSASSAGYTTTAEDIWGGKDQPYLKCVESIYDNQDVNWGIEKSYSRSEVKSMLEGRFGISLSEDHTQWFTVDRAYSVVYIDTVTIDGRSSCKLTGNQLCNMMGLKSNAITIKYKDGEFTFTSCGWGHGVGMSQWGAHYYAANGWTYDQILAHYYVDATLELSEPIEDSVEVRDDSSSSESSGSSNYTDGGDTGYYQPNNNYNNWWSDDTDYGQWGADQNDTWWQPETDQWTDYGYDQGYTDYGSAYGQYDWY